MSIEGVKEKKQLEAQNECSNLKKALEENVGDTKAQNKHTLQEYIKKEQDKAAEFKNKVLQVMNDPSFLLSIKSQIEEGSDIIAANDNRMEVFLQGVANDFDI